MVRYQKTLDMVWILYFALDLMKMYLSLYLNYALLFIN